MTETEIEVVDIEVPSTAYIPCPARGFKNRQVKKNCFESCGSFNGLQEVGGDVPFEEKYRVICAHPISRRMITVEVED